MSQADVSSQPLGVQFTLWTKVLNAAVTDNADYTATTLPFADIQGQLSSQTQAELAPVQPFLTTPLGQYFDAEWAAISAQQEQLAIKLITDAASAAGEPINTVTTNFPTQGTVIASTQEAKPASGTTPAQPGELTLSYQLNGCQVRFEHGSLTAYWLDTFNLALGISTPVPEEPFGFAPTTGVDAADAQFSPDNLVADAEAFLDDLFTALGNLFTGGSYESEYDLAAAAIEEQTDESFPLGGISQIATLLTQLNSAGPQLVDGGFTECGFSIQNGDTLVLTLTHPLDPGPVVQNANDPAADGELTNPPSLSSSQAEVAPGQTFGVLGEYFPVASDSALTLQWQDTSSGKAAGAALSVSGNGSSNTYTVNTSALSGGVYRHTVSGLKPGVEYTFSARCGDAYTWSLWTAHPLKARTALTDTADLILKPLTGSTPAPRQVGSAVLSATSTQWPCDATIPSGTPSGTYVLSAELSGTVIASVDITVGAISPNLVMIDPADQQIISPASVPGGGTFTVRGEGFPDGPVALTIDGQAAGEATAVGGTFELLLTAPGDSFTFGTLAVVASAAGASADLSVIEIGAPK